MSAYLDSFISDKPSKMCELQTNATAEAEAATVIVYDCRFNDYAHHFPLGSFHTTQSRGCV